MHAAYCDTDVHIIQFLVSTYRQQTVEIIPIVPFTKTKRVWLTLERVSRLNSSVFRKGKKADSRLAVKLSKRGENKAHKNKKIIFLKNKNKNKCEQGNYILSTTLAPSFSNQTARRRRHRRRRGACSCCMGKTQAWRKGNRPQQ